MDLHAVPGRRRSAALLAVALCAVLPAPAALAQAFHVVPEADRTMSEAEWQAMKARAVPDVRTIDRAAARPLAAPVFSTAPPELVPGNPGTAPNVYERDGFGLPDGEEGIEPENYGLGKLETMYHYNDYLRVPRPVRYYPWRAAGKVYYRAADGKDYYCTAALIAPSMIVTAAHCLHQGGNGDAGWNQFTAFVPAADGVAEPYGRCNASNLAITRPWYYDGFLLRGYDVGIIGCGKRVGTRRLIGSATGWFGHCASGCLLSYWFFTQIGYPNNYYDGDFMTVSQHLAEGLTYFDYFFGTGMAYGAFGGPQVANIGDLVDSSASPGQWSFRNTIFAVASAGFADPEVKQVVASSLSGPGDANHWKEIYNAVCNSLRFSLGWRACTPL